MGRGKGLSRRLIQKKYLKERVQSELQAEAGPHPFIVVLDHLKPGFNVAKIFRSANAFGCAEVLLVGIENFDVRAAMGAFKHTKSRRFADFKDCHAYLASKGYAIFALAPGGRSSLVDCAMPEKSAFVVGHEEFGLSFAISDFPDVAPLSIPQYGIVESLNVSNAATIVMYEWARRFERGELLRSSASSSGAAGETVREVLPESLLRLPESQTPPA